MIFKVLKRVNSEYLETKNNQHGFQISQINSKRLEIKNNQHDFQIY